MNSVRVAAPSRLHFGLFALPGEQGPPAHWPDLDGNPTIPARHFGGVGLMIDRPGIELSVASAAAWSASGPSAERALTFAQRVAAGLACTQPFRIVVERCAPEHAGLGTGTQLGLSVAWGLTSLLGHDFTAGRLAPLVGRGQRSALGIYGFDQGGFLVEGGKRAAEGIAPLVARQNLPPTWRVVLIFPSGLQGTHGRQEMQAFSALAVHEVPARQTDTLCRLVLLGLLPALLEQDSQTFGEALYDYNRRSGEMFRAWQGGIYSHPRIESLVQVVRSCGVPGVGQSSWGPAVFAVVASAATAHDVSDWLVRAGHCAPAEIVIAAAANGGAVRVGPCP